MSLPAWGVGHVKVKVDTGARTSALHAFGLRRFERGGDSWVRFEVHPWQRSSVSCGVVEAPVAAVREVRSSSGSVERRPVVITPVELLGQRFDIEITLTRRDHMGFRMLLGREALRGRFVVDPAASYLGGRPPAPVRQRNRGVE